MDNGGGSFFLIIFYCVGYFLPTIVATARRHRNAGPIFIVNLFLGWTLLAWVIALAMAFGANTMEKPKCAPTR